MGWGSTFRANIRYKGRIFKDNSEIIEEQAKVQKELANDWKSIRRLIITNPADYVSLNGDIRWNSFENTIDTISQKFDVLKHRIIENCKIDMVLSMMLSAIFDNADEKSPEYQLHKYGRYNFFTEVLENLALDETEKKYGTEILAYIYFSRRSLYNEYDLQSHIEEQKHSIESGFKTLEKYVLNDPAKFITVDNEEDEEPIRNYSEALFFLDSEFDGDKEWIEDACYEMARAEVVLNDYATAEVYMKEQQEKKRLYDEWQDKKSEVFDEVCKKYGYTSDNWMSAENWQQISEESSKLIAERGLEECPVPDYDY